MTSPLVSADQNSNTDLVELHGRVAQWIRHLTTNQGIPGSSPGRIVTIVFFSQSMEALMTLVILRTVILDLVTGPVA